MRHTIYYNIKNRGDGSVSLGLFSTEALATWVEARELEGFCESVGSFVVESEGPITIAKLETPESYFVQLLDRGENQVMAEFAEKFFPDGRPHFTAQVVELFRGHHRIEVCANGTPVGRVFCVASRSADAIAAELNGSAKHAKV